MTFGATPLSTIAERNRLPVLALTLGEPAGIGPEITFRAWRDRKAENLPAFMLVAPFGLASGLRDRLAPGLPLERVDHPSDALTVFDRALPVLETGFDHAVTVPEPGHPDARLADVVLGSIKYAVTLASEGSVAGVVTNPIAKSVLYKAGFDHPGHTEFLAALTQASDPPIMMLAIEGLRVVPLTVHIALSGVSGALSEDLITKTGLRVIDALRTDFGIARPRLAVAALNPHAGEDGAMGDEEVRIIAPAVASLRNAGHDVVGPAPADTLFHEAARVRYDAVLCMYHDQALIPLKTLDFDRGVNITLGLPIVRTSPDHGTAFDIAGRGLASAQSLIAAIRMAADIATRRKRMS